MVSLDKICVQCPLHSKLANEREKNSLMQNKELLKRAVCAATFMDLLS